MPSVSPTRGSNRVSQEKEIAARIISIEQAALGRWGKGDPSGYLELCDPREYEALSIDSGSRTMYEKAFQSLMSEFENRHAIMRNM
jgi:hypothetical protein